MSILVVTSNAFPQQRKLQPETMRRVARERFLDEAKPNEDYYDEEDDDWPIYRDEIPVAQK